MTAKQRYPAPLSNPDNAAIKQDKFCADLETLDDVVLKERTKQLIWLSAYAYNNPRSKYHWQVDACHDEAARRRRPEIYVEAYDETVRENCG